MALLRRPGLQRAGLCLLALFFLSACGDTQTAPYVTSYASTLAQEVSGKPKLCIVSYSVDALLYDSSGDELNTLPGPMEVSLARKEAKRAEAIKIATALAGQHLEQTARHFSSRFEISGPTGPEIVAYEPVTGTLKLAEAIDGCGAELGLAVRSRYGWDWDAENTNPLYYFYRTCAEILNSEGQAIWQFCGKGAVTQEVSFSLKGFLSAVGGTAPPVEEVVDQYRLEAECFPQLLLGLMEQDAAGKPHGTSLADYVDDEKAVHRVLIDNVGDRHRVPNW